MRRLAPVLMAVVASVVALLLCEAGLRLAPAESRLASEAAPRQVLSPDFVRLFEPDADDRILFHLKPRLDTTFHGKPLRTSSLGFRGPELRAGTDRIVGIGDSVMFGWGVPESETYLSLLERELAARRPAVECVNMAVPVYNTVQEVALLERHVAALRPRVVLLGFVDNDFQPASRYFPRAGLLERHSYLYRLLELRWRGFTPAARASWRRRRALEALGQLGEMARARGFRVVAFLYMGLADKGGAAPPPPQDLLDACRRWGFAVASVGPMYEKAQAEGEIHGPRDVWLSSVAPVDAHPNAVGHRIIARGLAPLIP